MIAAFRNLGCGTCSHRFRDLVLGKVECCRSSVVPHGQKPASVHRFISAMHAVCCRHEWCSFVHPRQVMVRGSFLWCGFLLSRERVPREISEKLSPSTVSHVHILPPGGGCV